jgi:hypothetical protein
MTRFPVLSKFLCREGLALAVETAQALADGTYWGVTTIYDDRNFPEPSGPDCGFGGGDGD